MHKSTKPNTWDLHHRDGTHAKTLLLVHTDRPLMLGRRLEKSCAARCRRDPIPCVWTLPSPSITRWPLQRSRARSESWPVEPAHDPRKELSLSNSRLLA